MTPTFDSGSCFVPHSNTPETSSISIQKSQRLKLKHRSFFFKKEKSGDCAYDGDVDEAWYECPYDAPSQSVTFFYGRTRANDTQRTDEQEEDVFTEGVDDEEKRDQQILTSREKILEAKKNLTDQIKKLLHSPTSPILSASSKSALSPTHNPLL